MPLKLFLPSIRGFPGQPVVRTRRDPLACVLSASDVQAILLLDLARKQVIEFNFFSIFTQYLMPLENISAILFFEFPIKNGNTPVRVLLDRSGPQIQVLKLNFLFPQVRPKFPRVHDFWKCSLYVCIPSQLITCEFSILSNLDLKLLFAADLLNATIGHDDARYWHSAISSVSW